MRLVSLVVASFGLLALGCKQPAAPTPDSTVSALDEFSGGNFQPNECSGTNKVIATAAQIVSPADLRPTVDKVLTAVPVPVQTAFFKDLKGRVILTEDIAADCKNNDAAVISCWQIVGGTPVIFVKQETKGKDDAEKVAETKKNVNHATVRAFAYFVSEFIMKLDAKGQDLVENDVFTTFKNDLSLALLNDVAAGEAKGYKLSAFNNLAPPQALDPKLTAETRGNTWKVIPPANKTKFNDYAFAEAYDSLHCSAETRAKLSSDFTGVEPIIGQASADLDAGLASSAGGMNLYGRWGAGNGPVRQGLRNWGSFRRSGGGAFNFRRAANGGGFIGRRRILWRR